MFKKNIDALKLKNLALAEKLENISLNDAKKNIEVYKAESNDLIISYEGLALDDIYNPIREAKTNWNTNVTKNPSQFDIVMVYGLGLGYLFKRAYISCESRILLFEPKIDILRYVLEYVDFSNEIADERVFVATDKRDILNYLSSKYLSDDNLFFLFPKAYAQLMAKEMADFTNDIVEVCNLKKMDVTTIKMLAKNWTNATLKNLNNVQKIRPFDWLKTKFNGKTALIAAAGPSLSDNIEEIKNNRDKFIIFAVNRATPVLFKNGVKPDFVMFSDVLPINHTIENVIDELKTTNIIADFRANSFVYDTFDNIFTYFSKNDIIAQDICNLTNNSFDLLETAGTATAQAYYSAKLSGCKKIIFAGMDLAYKDDCAYADGQKVEIVDNDKVYSGSHKKNLLKVKDLNGNDVLTRDDYALFIRQFDEIFTNDMTSELYNITSFGAFVKGMKYLPLKDILPEIDVNNDNISKITEQFREDTTEKWTKIVDIIENMLKNEGAKFVEIKDKSQILLDKNIQYLKLLQNGENNTDIQMKLAHISEEFAKFLPDIINDSFLSQNFQGDLANFVSLTNNTTQQGIETFVNMKNFEISFLNDIISVCTEWSEFLQKKYN